MSLEEYFSTGPDFERPVFEAVFTLLEDLGPMTLEPVSVGIFIKSNGTFVQLRPATKWVAMWFPMPRSIEDSRIARKPMRSGQRIWHMVKLREPDEIDGQIRAWLTEAYAHFG
jgi:hypothetical protein